MKLFFPHPFLYRAIMRTKDTQSLAEDRVSPMARICPTCDSQVLVALEVIAG